MIRVQREDFDVGLELEKLTKGNPRIGGVATAAIIANAMWGLVGFALAVLTLHLAAVPLGAPLALAVSVAVNCIIFMVRRAGHAARMAALNSAASPRA